jgi:hypothetical protein
MKRIAIVIAAGLALAVMLPILPVQAQRVFVSGAGSDTNPCTFAFPVPQLPACPWRGPSQWRDRRARHRGIWRGDHRQVDQHRQPGGVEAGISVASLGTAITISAGPNDVVTLRGLTLDGAATGSFGIRFVAGGSLSVLNSVIRNFADGGIDFVPNSSALIQLFVSDTVVSDGGTHGIVINPSGSGPTNIVLDHVGIENNTDTGLLVETTTQTINVTVNDSVVANNGADGIIANPFGGTPVNIMVRNSTIANNGSAGLASEGAGANVSVTRSTIAGNFIGWAAQTSGVLSSYNDNNIDGNGSANTAPPSLGYR